MDAIGLKNHGKIKYAVYALLAVMFYFLQSRAVLPEICGAQPILLAALAVSAAPSENAVFATIYGAVCGVLTDISMNGKIGYFAFSLTVVCCVGQYLMNRYLELTFFSVEFFAFAALVCVSCGQWAVFALPIGLQNAWEMFVYIYIPRTLYTFAVTVPLFSVRKISISGSLSKPPP